MKEARKPAPAPTAAAPMAPDLTTFLPHRLATLSRLTQSRLAAILEKRGITIAQWRVSQCLIQEGPSTLNGLSAFTQLPQSSLSRSVGKMHELGLVRNLRNPADRRVSKIEITAKGRKEMATAAEAIDKSWQSALRLDPAEIDAFIATVNTLIEQLSDAPAP